MTRHTAPLKLGTISLFRAYKIPYTLPSSVCSKSFICHSYENCRGGGGFLPILEQSIQQGCESCLPAVAGASGAKRRIPLWLLFRYTPTIFPRINTYKTVSKQRTLSMFRINTYEKAREGVVTLAPRLPRAPRGHSSLATFFK